MRKEYTLNIVTDGSIVIYNAIKDFLDSVPNKNYTMIKDISTFYKPDEFPYLNSPYNYMVYYDNTYGIYIIFFDVGPSRVGVICCDTYNDSVSVFSQQDIMFYGFSSASSNTYVNPPQSGTIFLNYYRLGYYFTVPTITHTNNDGIKFIGNYHRENNTVMFSMISSVKYPYATILQTEDFITYNLMFGGSTPYYDFNGGFFYGGDACVNVELYYTIGVQRTGSPGNYSYNYLDVGADGLYVICDPCFANMNFHIMKYYEYPSNYNSPFIADPYNNETHCLNSGANMPNPANYYKLHLFMRADIDSSTMRTKDDAVRLPVNRSTKQLPDKIPVKCKWIATNKNPHCIDLIISITNDDKGLPTYWPILSKSIIDRGLDVNTLNNISMCMPLYFITRRDPQVLDVFSALAHNDIINYVNMYNISTDRIINETYPDTNYVYNCFNLRRRRTPFGEMGYNGFAFRQE